MVRDHTFHYAAGISFRATLALFPLLVAGIVLLSAIGAGDRASSVVEAIASTDTVPNQTTEALRSQLDDLEAPGPGRVIGGIAAFLLALWSGAAAFRTVMTALNDALEIDDPRSLRRRFLVSLGLAALTATLALSATLLVAIGPEVGDQIRDIPGGSDWWFVAWRIARWPVVLALFLAWLSITYAYGPGERRRARTFTTGKVAAFVGWVMFAVAFSWYVDEAGEGGSLYGVFAGLVALQLYVYWSALILLLGAEIDCAITRRAGS